MNRRSFLKGILAVSAVAISTSPVILTRPMLYGDGIHDDTEALNAFLRGEPINIANDAMFMTHYGTEYLILQKGVFLVTRDIVVDYPGVTVAIHGNWFKMRNGARLNIDRAYRAVITHNVLDSKRGLGPLIEKHETYSVYGEER